MATTFYKLLGIDYPIIVLSCYRAVVAAISLAYEAMRAAAHHNGQYRFGHDSGVCEVDRSAHGVFARCSGLCAPRDFCSKVMPSPAASHCPSLTS